MTSGRMTDTKVCRSCGRVMRWRKSWERTWDEVRYCSDGCRRRGVSPTDVRLEEAILALLAERPRGAMVSPGEAARIVAGPEEAAQRDLAEPARRAARRLAAAGEVTVMQNGRPVDPSTAKGEVQVRLAERGGTR
jgi:hypothetical protein